MKYLQATYGDDAYTQIFLNYIEPDALAKIIGPFIKHLTCGRIQNFKNSG